MTTSTMEGLHTLALDRLYESPLNPRKHFDQAKLAELAASITAKGILTPLLVRPNGKGFEIAAGHRRYRAAKQAGVEQVPCVVRPMSDVDFLEVLMIENLQRDDLTALEEAEGYHALMTRGGYDVRRIADRVGRSEKYIYDRVKLLQLIEPAQVLLRDDKITAGHAILLARLKPADQQRAIDPDKGGCFESEEMLWDPTEDAGVLKSGSKHAGMKARTVRELDAWIAEQVRFDRTATDPMIFPETATVVATAREKAEKIIPITHDHYIQESARAEERTFGPRSWKRADGRHKSKTCEHAVTGVVVVGPGRGEAFKVCTAKEKCATHWGAEKRERERRAKLGQVGGSQAGVRARAEAEERRLEEARRREEAERARWKKAEPKILEAIAAAVKKAPAKPERAARVDPPHRRQLTERRARGGGARTARQDGRGPRPARGVPGARR